METRLGICINTEVSGFQFWKNGLEIFHAKYFRFPEF
jgi:hypothetical protein